MALRVDLVTLVVHDLDRVRAFYERVIGLAELAAAPGTSRLGAGGRALLELRHDAEARARSPREAGLFHTAFLLPHRADLGRWLAHAARLGIALDGAADHVVSEAVYLADPEGNGIEVYADRPADTWTWTDGLVTMRNAPLDRDGLLREGGAGGEWQGAPPGTRIGHIHLQVGEIAAAETFYRDVLGLALTARYSGGSFFAADDYHHQIAANVWHSPGAGVRAEPVAGLGEVALTVPTDRLEGIAARAAAVGLATLPRAGGLALRDPWGTRLAVAA